VHLRVHRRSVGRTWHSSPLEEIAANSCFSPTAASSRTKAKIRGTKLKHISLLTWMRRRVAAMKSSCVPYRASPSTSRSVDIRSARTPTSRLLSKSKAKNRRTASWKCYSSSTSSFPPTCRSPVGHCNNFSYTALPYGTGHEAHAGASQKEPLIPCMSCRRPRTSTRSSSNLATLQVIGELLNDSPGGVFHIPFHESATIAADFQI
jgi:hypothetical protein